MSIETAADISADLVALRAARTKLATGAMVREVRRDGRALLNGTPTVEGLGSLILMREQDYEKAVAREEGRPVRSTIRFSHA